MSFFYQKYPMALKDILASPGIEAMVLQSLGCKVNWPALKGVKAYAQRFGHSESAIRTGLSRANKNQTLVVEGSKQVALGQELQRFVAYFLEESFAENTFSLILTQLSTQQATERYQLNDLLTRLGYVKILANAYLRYGAAPLALEAVLKDKSLQDYIYAFEAGATLPANLETQLEEIYALKQWGERLRTFSEDLKTFLGLANWDTPEGYLNYLFARSSFHKNILTAAPYLPETYFPEVSILKTHYQTLGQMAHEHRDLFCALYCRLFS
jgi:DNA-binding transcriptional regulator PaaX